jgi:RHS repeat-associated protein
MEFIPRRSAVTLRAGVSFKCDPFGRRIEKSSSAGSSIYAYDGGNVIEEANASGAVVARYAQGLGIDVPLAMLRSGATSYYHADGLGSVTSLSNAAGSLAQTYGYDSFGKQTSSSGSLTNPFQYTARELDPETGLYYYRARYYDPTSGRFLSEDRLRYQGGANFYRYVQNSPLVWIDPSGDNLCYSVTPNGMTEKPCADPNGGMSCISVPEGDSCRVPIPPGPPGPALSSAFDSKYAPGCKCNPLNLASQAAAIMADEGGKRLNTAAWAGGTSGFLHGLEVGLEYFGAGAAAELIPFVDLALLTNDSHEMWKGHRDAQEKLRMLFKGCE